jgi:F-type H+-transporting ATPase subunit delta
MAGAAAKRYARAIFELAREEGQAEKWAERLASVRAIFSRPEVRQVLLNPTIPLRDRESAVGAILDERGDRESVNLAKLLVGSGRVDEVGAIEQEYQKLVDEAEGRVRATATTAVELSPDDYENLASTLSKQMGREVRLTAGVDSAIIGGLVLRVGDHVIDASLATRLQQLRRKLAGG